jgi:hypothetical protein
MFWLVMTIVAATLAVVYSALGTFGWRGRIGDYRRRRLRNVSWLAVGWTAVCLGHFMLQARP